MYAALLAFCSVAVFFLIILIIVTLNLKEGKRSSGFLLSTGDQARLSPAKIMIYLFAPEEGIEPSLYHIR
jgi:hypothetical protein